MSDPLSIIPIDSGIYKIINTVNGQLYVGSAVSLRRRRHQHFTSLRRGRHKNPHLQAAFNKYGESAFVFTVIEIVENKEDLIAREQFFIDDLNPEYNIHRIAGSSLGVKHTAETRARRGVITKLAWESESHRKRMSEAAKRRAARGIGKGTSAKLSASSKKMWETRDRTVPDDVRAKISETLKGHEPPNKGKPMSEEQRTKLKGRKVSEEARRKMSESAKKRTASPETKAKMSESQRKRQLQKRLRGEKYIPSKETREKMSEALKGRTSPMEGKQHSEESRRKMSEAKKGKPGASKGRKASEETRAKQRAAKIGKALAPEHRAKIAEKNRQRQAQARAAKEQEQLAKAQSLLARWENIEPSEPIDPNAHTPLTLWDIIDPAS